MNFTNRSNEIIIKDMMAARALSINTKKNERPTIIAKNNLIMKVLNLKNKRITKGAFIKTEAALIFLFPVAPLIIFAYEKL